MNKVIASNKLLLTRSSGNVFADLGFDKVEAANLLMRTDLMIMIEKWFTASGLTQREAAKVLGINQPRLNLLLKTKVDEFSLDALVNIAASAGLQLRLTSRATKAAKAA
jgi:predicted XRE-type DNA-binding protein